LKPLQLRNKGKFGAKLPLEGEVLRRDARMTIRRAGMVKIRLDRSADYADCSG
jgi:hypothetical protein